MKDLLKALGMSDALIAKALAEGADQAAIATEFLTDLDTTIETRIKPKIERELKESINASAMKAVHESTKTRLNRDFSLGLSGLKDVDFEDVLKKVKDQFESVKTSTDEETKAKLKEQSEKLTKALTDIDALNTQLTEKDKEVATAIESERSNLYRSTALAKHMGSVTWAFDEEEKKVRLPWLQDAFEKEISDYRVDKDGHVLTSDGQPVLKSDGRSIYKNLGEIIDEKIDTLGFRAKNAKGYNGRAAGAGASGGEGGDGVDRSYSQQMEQQLDNL